MMQPSAPLVQSSPRPLLRRVEHPDLSPVLTHFCDRNRPRRQQVPDVIYGLRPEERLENILWNQALHGFVPFSGGYPSVGLTESTPWQGLQFLIRDRGYHPWGLVFDRQSVFDAGGGPVWHARLDQWNKLKQLSDPDLQSWALRLDPASQSDWLEEREWRIPRPPVPDQSSNLPSCVVPLLELGLVALLVGNQTWNGARVTDAVAPATGQVTHGLFYPVLPPGLPRWWWDPIARQIQVLPPLF
jgi:hypothetical protein